MTSLVIQLTLAAVIICVLGFLLMFVGAVILLKLKKFSKKDFKFFVKIKAIAWALSFVVGWIMGFIAILLTR